MSDVVFQGGAAMNGFNVSTLVALYDQGALVPFIGSGISAGPCVNWTTMIDRLRNAAGLPVDSLSAGAATDLQVRRAAPAVLALACQGKTLADVLRTDLYAETADFGRNESLSKLYWPLVCTTNYDDTYLGARIARAKHLALTNPGEYQGASVTLPRIYGRSEADCRRILQHMASPVGEAYWALQGMLDLRPALRNDLYRSPGLEDELVVGPVEYRAVANRAQHFRRAFAEMFYHRSLLFLGAGLSEPYFLSLFDEALEMLGLPLRPHFALVDDTRVDPDYLRIHYNIICRPYHGTKEHCKLPALLEELVSQIKDKRPQIKIWGYRMDAGCHTEPGEAQFSVEGTPLPNRPSSPTEALVISVGRKSTSQENRRGWPMLGSASAARIAEPASFAWINDWFGSWPDSGQTYAVAAREVWSAEGATSRDLRSPEAVRCSFRSFLDYASANGVILVRSMLLAAGRKRTFQPWVSLAQMARAYGEWYASWRVSGGSQPLRVIVHVVTEDVLAMLRSGQLGLAERLVGNNEIRFRIEIVDRRGQPHVEQFVAREDELLRNLPVLQPLPSATPALGVQPYGRPSRVLRRFSYAQVLQMSLKNFGIVSGSTLIIDYRRTWGDSTDEA